MKRKDIEKAAEKYAEENSWYPGETSYESDIIAIEESFADAFKAGVKWRIRGFMLHYSWILSDLYCWGWDCFQASGYVSLLSWP